MNRGLGNKGCPSQVTKSIGLTSIRHRSDTFPSYRCLIDVDNRVVAIWELVAPSSYELVWWGIGMMVLVRWLASYVVWFYYFTSIPLHLAPCCSNTSRSSVSVCSPIVRVVDMRLTASRTGTRDNTRVYVEAIRRAPIANHVCLSITINLTVSVSTVLVSRRFHSPLLQPQWQSLTCR